MGVYAVTGSASGMGLQVAQKLRDAGHTVIGVDIKQADIVADLSTADGRRAAAAGVLTASGSKLDGAVLAAGLGPGPGADNKFGWGSVGSLRRNPFETVENLLLRDLTATTEEVSRFRDVGGTTIVDLTPPDIGRDAVSLKASRTSAKDKARTLLRSAWFNGDRRSSLRRRMTGRKVSPLTSNVNRTKPVARTATAFLVSGSMRVFSVTASASAKVSAPRNPPQAIASL